ncbi:MAG TPA: VOC family protein [Candidatus Aquilonibacter sp.]|nr:VOC family protein [Candidatus Aquilonibacter sp.]
MTQKSITPFLWFDTQAEEAAKFYCSIFEDSHVDSVGDLVVAFTLRGQKFLALNGGKQDFHFDESISFYVDCDTQEEVDRFWSLLTADGGEPNRCGWLRDKFGVSWQIIPNALPELMNDEDEEKSKRVFEAMMAMSKIDIAELERAYRGEA